MLNHRGTAEIRTERLLLRKVRPQDAQAMFHGWMKDERVAEYTSWHAHQDIGETRAYVQYLISLDNDRSYNWVIEADGKAVGTINVCYCDENADLCGIAYALSYEYWGKGIMTEALRAAARFLFEEVNVRKIIAGCDSANIGSRKVMEKAGMKQEACLRQQIRRKDGTFGDDLQYGLFRDELRES